MTDELLEPSVFKGLPLGSDITFDQLAATRWNVAAGDTATPVAVLRQDALHSNAETMRRYCAGRGIELAPHAKTTLSPELVALQLEHGAWAMTAALPRQVAALWGAGVPRVLMANELTDPAAAAWLAEQLDADDAKRLWCYVDSEAGVRLLDGALAHARRPWPVLLELGHTRGRTGCRDRATALAVAREVAASDHLLLAGVAGYEGTIGATRTDETVRRVDTFVADLAALADELTGQQLLAEAEPPLISVGGSIFFDRVAEGLADWAARSGGTVVLRSGCYLIHDHGLYAAGTPAGLSEWQLPQFAAALEVWSRVVSRPEADLVLLDAGRRDVSFDAGLPVPLRWSGRDGRPRSFPTGTVVEALSDQHAFVRLPEDVPVEGAGREGSGPQVGDLVALGISHPCTTLDRWRLLLLVDEQHTVVGGVRTNF